MKQADHKISDASFIGHYFKLLVARLKLFKTAKHVVLIAMVLICIFARYVILSADKNPAKPQTFTTKSQKFKLRTVKFIYNNPVSRQGTISQSKPGNLASDQTDDLYFFVNEAQ